MKSDENLFQGLNSKSDDWQPSQDQVQQFFKNAIDKKGKIIRRRRITQSVLGCFLFAGILSLTIPQKATKPDDFYVEMAATLEEIDENLLADIQYINEHYELEF
jgi:hypothetical protein